MTNKIKTGIAGGAGYTGGELIRLLLHHPDVQLTFVQSRSQAGKPVSSAHPDLIGETDLQFTAGLEPAVDVLFLCLGHGEAKKFVQSNPIEPQTRIIDLSHDFRWQENAVAKGADGNERTFVYGLPELNKEAIRNAKNIANPGCFATAIQLGLLPLAKAGLLEEVYTTGITGSTGAGQGLSPTSHFSWRAGNIQAYKTLTHQHMGEVNQSMRQLGTAAPAINFVPWRGDFARGIFISSMLNCSLEEKELVSLYDDFYRGQPFTFVSREEIFLKQVTNTNKCVIRPEKVGNKLVVHSAIDNLLKGASGQAIQNMNLMLGLDETSGLHLKASAF
jgi:N-acetyl-gamma-glutamyl-phosphate reductase